MKIVHNWTAPKPPLNSFTSRLYKKESRNLCFALLDFSSEKKSDKILKVKLISPKKEKKQIYQQSEHKSFNQASFVSSNSSFSSAPPSVSASDPKSDSACGTRSVSLSSSVSKICTASSPSARIIANRCGPISVPP